MIQAVNPTNRVLKSKASSADLGRRRALVATLVRQKVGTTT